MPTGYTAKIKDGITFEQYAWDCARAFGALIMMRDEPSDAPIPDKIEPSDYHEKALEKAINELSKLMRMSTGIAADYANEAWNDATESRERILEESDILEKSYTDMLAQVDKWVSPTPDHKNYKEFMRNQIIDSISHDCDMSYYSTITKLSGAEWLEAEKDSARHSIEYHTKAFREECERTDGRNAWIDALRKSLKLEVETND